MLMRLLYAKSFDHNICKQEYIDFNLNKLKLVYTPNEYTDIIKALVKIFS